MPSLIVEKVYADNSLRNFNYLLVCPQTGEALVIDPLAVDNLENLISNRGYTLKYILNTHEHHDHVAGNSALQKQYAAQIIGFHGLRDLIPNIKETIADGDFFSLGQHQLEVIHTPGHTAQHCCIFYEKEPSLFCGDTIFYAGVGNCHHGGHPPDLFETVQMLQSKVPEKTIIYPGHDYLQNNLNFSLNCEPSNQCASELLTSVKETTTYFHDLAKEKQINPFFRLKEASLRKSLQLEGATEKEVFIELRKLRDKW